MICPCLTCRYINAITSIYAKVLNLSEYLLLLQSRAALQKMAWRRRRNNIIWLVPLLSLSPQEATAGSTEDNNVFEEFVSQMLSRHTPSSLVSDAKSREGCPLLALH